MTLFAEDLTRCSIGTFEFPSTWFVALNGAFVIMLAPLFAWLWPKLGRHNPSLPAKLSWAMFFAAASFGVMVIAAWIAEPERNRAGPEWLFMNALLIFIGPWMRRLMIGK